MITYLTFRAFTVVAFVAASGALFTAGVLADERQHRGAVRSALIAALFLAIVGCLLISLGWPPETCP